MSLTPWTAKHNYAYYLRVHRRVPLSICPPIELPVLHLFTPWLATIDADGYDWWEYYVYWRDLQIATDKLTGSLVCLVAPLYSPRLHIGTYLPADLFRKLMLFLTCSWGND